MLQPPRSLDELWESIPTGPAPVAGLVTRGQSVRRRRRAGFAGALVAAVVGVVAVGAVISVTRPDAAGQGGIATAPDRTRWAAIGRVAVAVPEGWADGAATCNAPFRDTVFFPYPQDCVARERPAVSSVALTTGAFTETGTRLGGLVPTEHIDGHQVVAGPTDCRTASRTCVAVFGVPDLHAYVTVTVPHVDGTKTFARIEAIRASLTVLPDERTAVPFVAPGSSVARYRADLEAAGLSVDVRSTPCPPTAFCAPGVTGTSPAAGRVVPAGSTVTIEVTTSG